jgi:hypothetical protein
MFERTMSDHYLDLWLQHLPEAARPAARDHARDLALAHPDLAAAATVLLKLEDPGAAEARLLAEPGRIDGNQYGSLVPLAKALRNHDCPRAETVIYRALLKGILDRAYARAYGHAARYWSQLQQIANGTTSLLPLTSHDEFEAEIRARHGRKTAFCAHVNGTRREWRSAPSSWPSFRSSPIPWSGVIPWRAVSAPSIRPSLMETGTPSIGDSGLPRFQRRSEARATLMAASWSMRVKTLRTGLSRSARARIATIVSRGEALPAP